MKLGFDYRFIRLNFVQALDFVRLNFVQAMDFIRLNFVQALGFIRLNFVQALGFIRLNYEFSIWGYPSGPRYTLYLCKCLFITS